MNKVFEKKYSSALLRIKYHLYQQKVRCEKFVEQKLLLKVILELGMWLSDQVLA